MPAPAQAFAALRRLTPQEAVGYLRDRNQITQTYNWTDLWQEEHSRQFTVSRLANADLLADMQRMITDSVGGDLSRRDFMRDAQAALKNAGWWGERQVLDPSTGEIVKTTFEPSRLKLIFDTNTRMAYAAGQWERVQSTQASHPYLRYVTQRDDKVRASHRAWDNVTLPASDPFWSSHFPPNGWRCRCRVVQVSRRDYERGLTPTGAAMNKAAPDVVMRDWLDRSAGKVRQVPAGIDPGFGYNPGAAKRQLADMSDLVQGKLATLPSGLASGLQDRLPGLQQLAAMDYVLSAWSDKKTKQAAFRYGKVPPELGARAAHTGAQLSDKVIGLDHDNLLHTIKHHAPAQESDRGQLPVTAYDVGRFDSLLNLSTLSPGNPSRAADGAMLLKAVAVDAGVEYEMVVKVRRKDVVLYTMWKRKLK